MDYETLDRIFYLSMVAILFPIILLFTRYKRQSIEYRWLTFVLVFSFLCDFVNEVQYQTIHFPVNYIGNFHYIVGPILVSIFFYHALGWPSAKIPFIIFIIAYFLFSMFNFFLIQKTTINTYSAIIEKLQVMILCILFFYKVIRELPAARIYQIGLFWIVSAFFIVNSAKLVLYSFAYYLIIFKDNLLVLWTVHNILSILLSLAIAAGIVVHYRHQPESTPQHSRP